MSDENPMELVAVTEESETAVVLAKLATAAAKPTQVRIDGEVRRLLHLVPEGYTIHSEPIDPEPQPVRAKGNVRLITVEGLVDYVKQTSSKREAPADIPVTIWVHPTSGEVVAILNDHSPHAPGWRDLRATLQLAKTTEWNFWLNRDGQLMQQTDFADHIERGLKEIVSPPAADMLEMAQHFQAKVDVDFEKGQRLATGETRLTYKENVSATAGRGGQFEFPSEFVIRVAPFVGEEPVELKALTRFKINSGDLRICYILDRPQDVIQQVVDSLAGKFSTAGFERVYIGQP